MPARRITAALLALALAASGVGCARDDALSGRVIDHVVTVSAPALGVAWVDTDAGFSDTMVSTGARRSSVSTAAAIAGLGQYARVATVTVEPGDRVETGDVIAVFETAALAADVDAAKAARATAKAQLPVIDKALDDVASGRGDVRDARATLDSTIADVKKQRAQLVDKRAQLKAILASLPPSIPATLPPGVPRPPDPAQIKAAIAKLDAGIAKIDAGLEKAQAGYAKLDAATGRLRDAKAQLDDARDLARIAADTTAVGVKLAQWRLANATVRAPHAGLVVDAVSAGDALAPGATVATIRREGRARVSTWITPEQLAELEPSPGAGIDGARWRLTGDWADGEVFSATVSHVGVRAVYPPTSFATKDVHLTRALPVELEVEAGAMLPAGAPVDVLVP